MKTALPAGSDRPVSAERLLAVSAFAARHLGLHFPPARWDVLARRLRAAARAHHGGDLEAYLDWLLGPAPTQDRLQSLAVHLTVGETYFYREPAYLEGLRYEILPALIEFRQHTTRTLRLWSAGCCTGEEAYTLAALIDLLLGEKAGWTVEIYGTDINPRFLAVAERGQYRTWSFRNTPRWMRERYFREVADGLYEVVPALRARVRFGLLNLAETRYPRPFGEAGFFDVILCRNVLMYFESGQRCAVLQRLAHALDPEGYLLLSGTEHLPEDERSLRPVRLGSCVYYQKTTGGQESEPEVLVPAVPVRPALPGGERGSDGGVTKDPASVTPRSSGTRVHGSVAVDAAGDEAGAMLAEGRFEECLAWIEAREEEAVRWHGVRARALANLGRYEEALVACEAALATDPIDPVLHYLRGMILQAQGASEQAMEAMRQALFLDPDFAVARLAYGRLLQAGGRVEAARKQYRLAARAVSGLSPETLLPEADGLTAGQFLRLAERMAHFV
ncbi:MAG: protein-glutamate O-methyltransferase [Rhodothermaceae bacterium]|nr:MAG: protein-glutamate O-methyltransferase [Rhodothermaceae bacterium]